MSQREDLDAAAVHSGWAVEPLGLGGDRGRLYVRGARRLEVGFGLDGRVVTAGTPRRGWNGNRWDLYYRALETLHSARAR